LTKERQTECQVLENKEFENAEILFYGQLDVVFENKFATFFVEFTMFCKKALQIRNYIFTHPALAGQSRKGFSDSTIYMKFTEDV